MDILHDTTVSELKQLLNIYTDIDPANMILKARDIELVDSALVIDYHTYDEGHYNIK